ncbi:hypothetical protein BKA19_1878 [Blastococcus saxobsidens]|uniref:Uncharacterized protein n=1 Tax=Blastococcus saxobsidens TaxID=138336 RepID=A0A4Q7Y7I3_9ACTN|nr:hypothetical protein BKA19_1878 [Blastococcus saxobsidens]
MCDAPPHTAAACAVEVGMIMKYRCDALQRADAEEVAS